jgi:hypothetical protein
MLYVVPVSGKVGYQFVLGSFEIPLSLSAGMNFEILRSDFYFGYFMKAQTGLYWRINMDMAVGVNGSWWWTPQWTKDKAQNIQGHFIIAGLGIKMHM